MSHGNQCPFQPSASVLQPVREQLWWDLRGCQRLRIERGPGGQDAGRMHVPHVAARDSIERAMVGSQDQ
jgi:hypothetical protein